MNLSFLRRWLRFSKRFYSSTTSASKLVSLTNRSVFEVTGKDSAKLLQGLITNDIGLLSETNRVIHTYLLNVQGRIINDVLIYSNSSEENNFLVECDLSQCDPLSQHLKKYKLRSKVKFANRNDLKVFSLFGNNIENHSTEIPNFLCDPRMKSMGYRLVSENNIDAIADVLECPIQISTEDSYLSHRYSLGISEGITEVENGIPLEHNGAFLDSINFNKGCYVGQELVARANFTGVIRKRVMPVVLEKALDLKSLTDTTVYNQKGKRAGKILGVKGVSGIGLLRLNEALNKQHLVLRTDKGDVTLTTDKPDWWPE